MHLRRPSALDALDVLSVVRVELGHHLHLLGRDVRGVEHLKEVGRDRGPLVPLGEGGHHRLDVRLVVGVDGTHLLDVLRRDDKLAGLQEPVHGALVEEGEGLDILDQALLCSLL